MIISVDHKLRIARSQLPPEILDLIVEALTIPYIERQKAMDRGTWGWWNLPETIELWGSDKKGQSLLLPRGFWKNLLSGLTELSIQFQIADNRVFDDDLHPMGNSISLHPWQEEAVSRILTAEQGIWKAPAGSGKTVGVLEAIRRLNCPSIVVVNTKDILYQWRDRARSFLGRDFPVGIIGDGHFEISDYLTVATAQTLTSRFETLRENGFFEQFSLFCLDECHHATAETYSTIVDRFSSRYRFGVSATPEKTGDFALAENILGPVFHETKRKEVTTIIEPHIFKISTRFTFAFRGRVGRSQSNYPQLINELINDQERNRLIAKSILFERDHHCLIVSKRLEHIEYLMHELAFMGYPNVMMRLTGEETSDARAQIIRHAQTWPCAVFSTLADEALDIPRLDRLFLAFPQRNSGLVEQQVGRICRQSLGKVDAKVFDFADLLVGPLEAQWRSRRLLVYQPNKYNITAVRAQDVMEFET